VRAPAAGVIASSLKEESEIARGALLARIQEPDGKLIELRSPLPGKINKILKTNGAQVSAGDEVLNINSDEDSVFQALLALAFIGKKEDLPLIQSYTTSNNVSNRVREQAGITAKQVEQAARPEE
jgi:pyruvate/2-oxoglutarate dehydrogenase complex dihydrolipoamide acyltransferase (E2) component